MVELSLITCVLDSHKVVARQLTWLDLMMPDACELILIDDGSTPPLVDKFAKMRRSKIIIHPTNDFNPWTHPKARNIGAKLASGTKLLLFDIDHIITSEVIHSALSSTADKLHWYRRYGVLDEYSQLCTDSATIVDYGGVVDSQLLCHRDMFMIKKSLFDAMGGYNEALCGQYGVIGRDFGDRYADLVDSGKATKVEFNKEVFCYVFPNPTKDVKGLFHKLDRESYRPKH